MVPHFPNADALAFKKNEVVEVAANHGKAFLNGNRRNRFSMQKGLHVPKDPGIAFGATGNHDTVAARFFLHAQGIFGVEDITVAKDGNPDTFLTARMMSQSAFPW